MRIPTSVFVMSVLTAAPFGLAIRDTLREKPRADPSEWSSYEPSSARGRRDDAERLAAYERELARQAEAEEEARKKHLVRVWMLFGSRPASLGVELGSAPLGTALSALSTTIDGRSIGDVAHVRQLDDGEILHGVIVELDSGICESVRSWMVNKWGPTTNGVWLDPGTHQRARFDEDECTVAIERYLDTTDWVTALPWDAIGKPAVTLTASLGRRISYSDDASIEWKLPGLGLATGASTVSALLSDGKVTGFDVSAAADFDTQVAIREAISARLSVQPTHQLETYAWKHKRLPTMLATSEHDDRFSLMVGKTGDE